MYTIEQFERGNVLTIQSKDRGKSRWKYLMQTKDVEGNPKHLLLNTETAQIMAFNPEVHTITDYEVGE